MRLSFLFLMVVSVLEMSLAAPEALGTEPRRRLALRSEDNAIQLTMQLNGSVLLSGLLGTAFPNAVGRPSICPQSDSSECYWYQDFAMLEVNETADGCSRFRWTSTFARRLEDCFDLVEGHHWYGGGETYFQTWPIENVTRPEAPFITGDSFAKDPYGCLIEAYWLISTKISFRVDEDVPLFMSWNTNSRRVCFVAKSESPYEPREELHLTYDICVGENVKDVHQRSLATGVIPKPTGIPDVGMLTLPFWSTWVQFKTEVNQSLVIDWAHRILSEGFVMNSHIEIDDHWETCYGEAVFDPLKFPDPAEMVQVLKSLGFGVTLWIHPFINIECPSFQYALEKGYFVKGSKGMAGLTKWWQGKTSGTIDFTNSDAVAWWKERLTQLQQNLGIDSFKFDAGETHFLPVSPTFQNGDLSTFPNIYTTKFVEAMESFGGLVEVRSGWKNQQLPIFSRILDRESRWGHDNGLRSVIPAVLQFSIVGYPYVLPDMIGGNSYDEGKPSKELYIRWMQLNTFMPAFQFSLVPWDYNDTQVVEIALAVLRLRETYSASILNAAHQSVLDGSPINRPIWWLAPEDPDALAIDSEYLLGDGLLVAPVLEEGAVTRDIYLPAGTWTGHDGQTYEGSRWLRNYPAPLDTLPFFIRELDDESILRDLV